jgi:hypothetical protein
MGAKSVKKQLAFRLDENEPDDATMEAFIKPFTK